MTGWQDLATEVMRRHRGCDFVVDRLVEQGVETLFGLPADSINALFDAARKNPRIEVITCRHESNAALMASAFGKLTGRSAAVVATNGPGATHLPVGTRDALLDEAPLITICGSNPHALAGTESFQAVDGQALMSSTTRASHGIWSSEALNSVRGMLTVAEVNSLPVALTIGQDVLTAPAKRSHFSPIRHPRSWRSGEESIERARALVSSSKRPVALVGDIRDAPPGLLQSLLDGSIDGPVLSAPSSIQGLGWGRLPARLRLLETNSDPWTELQKSDLVLAVGRWPGEILSMHTGPVIHLCTSPKPAAQFKADVSLLGTAWQDVLPISNSRPHPSSVGSETDEEAPSAEVGRTLDSLIPSDAVLALESGAVMELVWASVPERSRRFTSSFSAKSRGYAIPAAIGAKAALPAKHAVAVVDLLGWNFGSPEILTSIKHRMQVSIIALGGPESLATMRTQAQALGMNVGSTLAEELQPNTIYSVEAPELDKSRYSPAIVAQVDDAGSESHDRAFSFPETAALFASGLSKSGKQIPVVTVTDEEALLRTFNGLLDAAFDRTGLVIVTKEDTADEESRRNWPLGPAGAHFKAIPHIPLISNEHTSDNLKRARILAETNRSLVHLQIVRSTHPTDGRPRYAGTPHADVALCDRTAISAVADSIERANKITILSGRGAADSAMTIEKLAGRLDATVVASMGGGVGLDLSPTFAGYVGSSGHQAAHRALLDADVTLLLGMSNRGGAFEVPGRGSIFEINIDAFTLATSPPNRRKIVGTVKDFIESLHTELNHRRSFTSNARRRGTKRHRQHTRRQIQQLSWWKTNSARALMDNSELQPSQIIRRVDEICAGYPDVRFVGDVGLNTLWLYRFKRSHASTVWTQSFATMGFSVPAGAAASENSRAATVAVIGDGGIAMALPGLADISSSNPPLLVIVLDNKGLGAIRYEQEILGWPEYESFLENGDLARLARTIGWKGVQVTTGGALEEELTSFLSQPTPTLLQVACTPDEAPVPAAIPSAPRTASMIYSWIRQGRRGIRSARSTVRQVLRG